jgi:hypothetical protein
MNPSGASMPKCTALVPSTNPMLPRNAFRFAFENIKPTDGVIVGMYPEFFDEITANTGYTREFGQARATT